MAGLPLEHLREAASAGPLGLYLHIPFCRDRCTYCSFVTTRDGGARPSTLARLEAEITAWGEALDHPRLDTLYMGGGTPSTLEPERLEAITGAVRRAFRCEGLLEATLEANPGTVTPDWLRGARALGWDRLSLGIQTLDDGLLRRLGRIHDAREGLASLAEAQRAGFRRLSADLMIGIPGQDLARVLDDARRLVEAGASHLSIYMLDLDKPCPLKTQVDMGILALPDEEAVAEVFEALQEALPALGLRPYEISNYSRAGEESRHNTRYWLRRPYLGLGPGAASHLGAWRWTEDEGIEAWAAGSQAREVQVLDEAAALAEVPLLGLRMAEGVDWEALRAQAEARGLLALVKGWEKELEPFHAAGLLVMDGPRRRFTPKGFLLSNAVFQVFI